jgi:hypothetical protein
MVAVLDSMMFAAAFAAAMWVYAFTLVPALPRIAAVLRGQAYHGAHDAFVAVSDRRVRTRARPAQRVRPVGLREAA